MSSWTHGAQANEMSHFSTTRTLSDPHPERLSPPDRRDVAPWQPFIGADMSSTDLNNEDHFSDYPKRLPSFDVLFRARAQLSPEHFFRNLERQSGDNEGGIFVPETAIRAPDHFEVNSLPCCCVARAIRLRCTS
jgi:hypothetical protein